MSGRRQVISDPAVVLQDQAAHAARVWQDTLTRLAPDFGVRAQAWDRLPGAERALLTEACLQMILVGGWADGG